MWFDAPLSAVESWESESERQALLRALLFRLFSDRPFDAAAYAPLLVTIAST